MTLNERAIGGFLALACGDALANGVEFSPRGSADVKDMNSTRRYLPVGQWSDDTGLALCLGESLVAKKGFNAADQMRRYEGFYDRQQGWPCELALAPGNTLGAALKKFKYTDEPFAGSTHPLAAGNGGLMRLLPAVLAAHPDLELIRLWARESTRTTHGAEECLEASELLAVIIHHLLLGEPKIHALEAGKTEVWKSKKIAALAQGDYLQMADALIKAKSYVVDTLEAALWCFGTTDSLEAALLAAANLGDDCDTVAAITGQLAGCHYGLNAIPADWLNVLVEKDRIEQLARSLIDLTPGAIANSEG
ncbi:ADP-ribosylglycohydrolase family protein [Marinobacter sp. SS8-8]|uniref:ADP-ribosylglycohydrolase family protein n=1 Tax=Marinobacter sp. SS8-8 TaxID=3050452 RepID=UPI0026DF7C7B|nr:ADP-ribosylglycohydrolase family protein [Marinobacter sp. SS8-8]